MWSVINNFMTRTPQMADDYAFEIQACMIASDVNSHEGIVPKNPNKKEEVPARSETSSFDPTLIKSGDFHKVELGMDAWRSRWFAKQSTGAGWLLALAVIVTESEATSVIYFSRNSNL